MKRMMSSIYIRCFLSTVVLLALTACVSNHYSKGDKELSKKAIVIAKTWVSTKGFGDELHKNSAGTTWENMSTHETVFLSNSGISWNKHIVTLNPGMYTLRGIAWSNRGTRMTLSPPAHISFSVSAGDVTNLGILHISISPERMHLMMGGTKNVGTKIDQTFDDESLTSYLKAEHPELVGKYKNVPVKLISKTQ